ncbi:hypothetical protein ACOSQ2_010108 [Xanthoceras sorbifolium]
MSIDDSFKKSGAVPFKWEIRPGVPKSLNSPPAFDHQHNSPDSPTASHRHNSLSPPHKLRPPPAAVQFPPSLDSQPRTQSFRSTPRTRSERWRFDQPTRLRPEAVSPGCFPSPFLRRKESKRWLKLNVGRPKSEAGYSCDLETLGRWSVSSRKSLSELSASPASSSFSSYKSSPRPMSDAEWAGFGLF